MISSKGKRVFTSCDYCEKRVYRHVCIGVRLLRVGKNVRDMGWGFFEGHQDCWPKERRKMRQPVKSGTISRYRYR